MGMTTVVVERPAMAEAEVLEYLDFDPLTAIYVAPQACSTTYCTSDVFCCNGWYCIGRPGQMYGFCNKT